MAKDEVRNEDQAEWVPVYAGALIASRLGLPETGFFEGLLTGKIGMWGERFGGEADGTEGCISLRDVHDCLNPQAWLALLEHSELRERGRRLPRFIKVKVNTADIRKFAGELSPVGPQEKPQEPSLPKMHQAILSVHKEIWPQGEPDGLTPGKRDKQILDLLKQKGLHEPNRKTRSCS